MFKTKGPEKIVVMRYRFIGDTLLTLPFLRALREEKPDAIIHLCVDRDAYEVMEQCPYINKAVLFMPREWGVLGGALRLQIERYNTAYILKRSFSSAFMAFIAGVPKRIGFNTEWRGLLLTKRIKYLGKQQHEAQSFLNLLQPNTHQNTSLGLDEWIPDYVEKSALEEYLAPNLGKRVVLHVASTNKAKCWPLEHFVNLAQQLLADDTVTLYFFGVYDEKAMVDALIAQLPEEVRSRCYNYCAHTRLFESLALLKHMDLVIANDSGMLHMASSVNTPVVGIFGPTSPVQWGPLSEKARVVTHPQYERSCPCGKKVVDGPPCCCLTDITPQMVLDACSPFLTV